MIDDGKRRREATAGTRIEVRVPADVLERIDRWAEMEGATRAEVVRHALVSMFDAAPSQR